MPLEQGNGCRQIMPGRDELLQMAASYQAQGDTLRINTIDNRSGVRSELTFSATLPAGPAPCP